MSKSNLQKDKPAKTPENVLLRIVFEEVDRSCWSDLERLFEGAGGPKNCWCMVWRASGQEARKTDGRSRKSGLKRRVDAGVPVGILGYLDGEPIAWCSVAPRETYRRLGGLDEPTDASGAVWSLVCFYIPRAFRGHGIPRRLLGAAAQVAMQHGARVLEAYPVDRNSPSYRFMGFVPLFQAAGFEQVGRAGTRRHVMRLELKG